MSALDELQAVVFKWKENISLVKPTLLRKNNCYRLQLVELTDDNSYHTMLLDKCINWTEDQLKDWIGCKRMAWDMWDFKNRRDAEKFITLFHLSCPQ